MDIDKLLGSFGLLGITVDKDNPVQQQFMLALEEADAKIKKLTGELRSKGELMSTPELNCYEKCISNLSFKILEENISFFIFLLKPVLGRLKCFAGKSMDSVKPQIHKEIFAALEVCKNIRTSMADSKKLFKLDKNLWSLLYRIMKFERIFKIKSKQLNLYTN